MSDTIRENDTFMTMYRRNEATLSRIVMEKIQLQREIDDLVTLMKLLEGIKQEHGYKDILG